MTHPLPDAIAQAFAGIDARHDDDPADAARALMALPLEALPESLQGRAGFLCMHVCGELLGQWPQALEGIRRLLGGQGLTGADTDTGTGTGTAIGAAATAGADAAAIATTTSASAPPPALWRHAAVCAVMAGDPAQADAWTRALAQQVGAPLAATEALVSLAVAQVASVHERAADAGRLALHALRPLAELQARPQAMLDTQFGALCNNFASALSDRPLDDLDQADLRTALALLAEHALQFWQRAGTWVHQERAHYLEALCSNALGHGTRGEAQAQAGLGLLDRHDGAGEQAVDRAFLSLELAVGRRLQGRADGGALDAARALAAGWGDDAGLSDWFAERCARGDTLLARQGLGPLTPATALG